jgi:hypothetical protein
MMQNPDSLPSVVIVFFIAAIVIAFFGGWLFGVWEKHNRIK